MGEFVKGKGSELYVGLAAGFGYVFTEADKVANITSISEVASEFNVLEVEPSLDADTQEKIPGLRVAPVITVTGNLKTDKAGYSQLKAAHTLQGLVRFGIARPGTLDGVEGDCFISKLTISEAKNEGLYTFTADLTTSGTLSPFVKPIVPPVGG